MSTEGGYVELSLVPGTVISPDGACYRHRPIGDPHCPRCLSKEKVLLSSSIRRAEKRLKQLRRHSTMTQAPPVNPQPRSAEVQPLAAAEKAKRTPKPKLAARMLGLEFPSVGHDATGSIRLGQLRLLANSIPRSTPDTASVIFIAEGAVAVRQS